jgi:hypothetical protein
MPAMTPESLPEPLSSSTLPSRMAAPGATPRYLPPDFAPVPATIEATWVPWPYRSTLSGAELKFRSATSRSARSGCVWSTPLSSTATVVPVPVYPASHAAGAPICRTLWSRSACRLPSSQIRDTPAAVVRAAAPSVNASHTAVASLLAADSATASMLGSSRVTGALASRAPGARPAGWLTISGTVSLPASS